MTLGHVGELVIPGLVVISTFGAANAGILCGSRIVFAAARGGMLPGVFSKIHNTFKTPIPALLLQVIGEGRGEGGREREGKDV